MVLLQYSTVCVCVFFPFILDIMFVGRTSRGHTGGRSHRISHPPSFCGACLHFSREKDSATLFPRRPRSRILCADDLIVLHPLGIFIFVFCFVHLVNSRLNEPRHCTTVPSVCVGKADIIYKITATSTTTCVNTDRSTTLLVMYLI